MGEQSKIESIRSELANKTDQASFLVSRGTLDELLAAEKDLQQLRHQHNYLKQRRVQLNVKLMKDYKEQMATQRRDQRIAEQQRKRQLLRKKRQAEKRVQSLEEMLQLQTTGTNLMIDTHKDIFRERIRQIDLRGQQRHPMEKWLVYILEEVGEVAQAIQSVWGESKETDTPAEHLYDELIQASALLMAAAEQVREETQHGESHTIRTIGHTRSDQ